MPGPIGSERDGSANFPFAHLYAVIKTMVTHSFSCNPITNFTAPQWVGLPMMNSRER